MRAGGIEPALHECCLDVSRAAGTQQVSGCPEACGPDLIAWAEAHRGPVGVERDDRDHNPAGVLEHAPAVIAMQVARELRGPLGVRNPKARIWLDRGKHGRPHTCQRLAVLRKREHHVKGPAGEAALETTPRCAQSRRRCRHDRQARSAEGSAFRACSRAFPAPFSRAIFGLPKCACILPSMKLQLDCG